MGLRLVRTLGREKVFSVVVGPPRTGGPDPCRPFRRNGDETVRVVDTSNQALSGMHWRLASEGVYQQIDEGGPIAEMFDLLVCLPAPHGSSDANHRPPKADRGPARSSR